MTEQLFAFEFSPPTLPWGANDDPGTASARIERSHNRRAWRGAIGMLAKQEWRQRSQIVGGGALLLPLPPSCVQVTIPFQTKRRRDPHNYTSTVVKSVIDGLVDAGLWPDDTAEWVTVLDPCLTVGRLGSVVVTARSDNDAEEEEPVTSTDPLVVQRQAKRLAVRRATRKLAAAERNYERLIAERDRALIKAHGRKRDGMLSYAEIADATVLEGEHARAACASLSKGRVIQIVQGESTLSKQLRGNP